MSKVEGSGLDFEPLRQDQVSSLPVKQETLPHHSSPHQRRQTGAACRASLPPYHRAMSFLTLNGLAADSAKGDVPHLSIRDVAGEVGTVAASPALRVIMKDQTTPERRTSAARRLMDMARAKPVVKASAKGITAELRRRRNLGELG